MRSNRTNHIIVGVMFAIFCYAFSCGYESPYDSIYINNQTSRILYIAISTEYPNTYLPDKDWAWNIILPNSDHSTVSSKTDRYQLFKECQILQVIVYQTHNLSQPDLDYLKNNHCELVIYQFTKQELETLNWTVTVTEEDIREYQATHETVPMKSPSE